MSGPSPIAAKGGYFRFLAKAIAIYFVAWLCWSAAVYYGFRWFVEWAHIHPDAAWESDPTRFQRLLALPPLVPVLIWSVMVLGARRRRNDVG